MIVLPLLLVASALAAGSRPEPVVIPLGHSVATLTGPWRFHTGDDTTWADPRFDDSAWETVDLTPSSPDAHDSDVGLKGWVSGWAARGHARYTGFAWYRIRVVIADPARDSLALLGPLQVDDAYQLFVDGHLAGGAGDFSRTPPIVSNTKPRRLALPHASDTIVIAIRAYAGPRALLGDPNGGGIRIAPALGEARAIEAQYQLQWLEKFNGYVVDAVEGMAFIPLAIIVLVLMRFDPNDRGYWWRIAALVLIGMRRGNQAFFFWFPYETRAEFGILIGTFVIPLMIGTWLMAWRGWFEVRRPSWLPYGIGALTVLLSLAQTIHAGMLAQYTQWVLTAIYLYIVIAGVRQQGREGWLAVPSALLIAMALFPGELSALHIPGIWFPFGVGVSRTEYAIAAFFFAEAALLLYRLLTFAPQHAPGLSSQPM